MEICENHSYCMKYQLNCSQKEFLTYKVICIVITHTPYKILLK